MANKNNKVKENMKKIRGRVIDWLVDQIAKSENYATAEANVHIDFINKI